MVTYFYGTGSSSVSYLGRPMWSRAIKTTQGHSPSYTHVRKSKHHKTKKQIDFSIPECDVSVAMVESHDSVATGKSDLSVATVKSHLSVSTGKILAATP